MYNQTEKDCRFVFVLCIAKEEGRQKLTQFCSTVIKVLLLLEKTYYGLLSGLTTLKFFRFVCFARTKVLHRSSLSGKWLVSRARFLRAVISRKSAKFEMSTTVPERKINTV